MMKMTKKRFTLDNEENGLCKCILMNGEEIPICEVVELLNELYEENKELQRHLDVMRSGALTDDKRIKELYDENEQLKHWNKCLAEKRHQELSYGYYTDSKAEKDLRDLLEPKSFNCSDR